MEIKNTKINGQWFYKIAYGEQEENYLELTIPNPYKIRVLSKILNSAAHKFRCGIFGYTTDAGGEYVESVGINWKELTAISGKKEALDLFEDYIKSRGFYRANEETFYRGAEL